MYIPVILPDHGGLGGYAKTKFSFLKICLKTLNEEELEIIISVKKSFVSVCIVNIFLAVCIAAQIVKYPRRETADLVRSEIEWFYDCPYVMRI